MKKVLVLGANGFIGSHAVDNLARRGFQVVAFDRYSTPAKFDNNPAVVAYVGDIFSPENIARALEDVDFVLHAFSATTPYTADRDPYEDIEKNILNNVRIFEQCAEHHVQKIAYISSGGAIYGTSAENGKSAKETDAALPISPYGIGKLTAERYLEYFERKYGLQHVSYRLSNPYGPRQVTKHNQGVVPRFIEYIREGKTITLYGDGSSSRDYIYIEDAIDLIVGSFEHCKESIYNIGSGEQTPLTTLINCIEELLHKTAQVERLPEPTSFVHRTQLDISRYTNEFNHAATTDLRTGLARTI